AIAASAVSLSRAVRVSWPSSLRIPATSSRMSSSSSTIRMSDAISDLFSFSFFCRLGFAGGRRCALPDGQENRDHGAAAAVEIGRRVVQLEMAAMVLDDLLDDREAQARPLLPGGHIGLEQPLAILARQTLAIVDHVDADPIALGPGDDADYALLA